MQPYQARHLVVFFYPLERFFFTRSLSVPVKEQKKDRWSLTAPAPTPVIDASQREVENEREERVINLPSIIVIDFGFSVFHFYPSFLSFALMSKTHTFVEMCEFFFLSGFGAVFSLLLAWSSSRICLFLFPSQSCSSAGERLKRRKIIQSSSHTNLYGNTRDDSPFSTSTCVWVSVCPLIPHHWWDMKARTPGEGRWVWTWLSHLSCHVSGEAPLAVFPWIPSVLWLWALSCPLSCKG